MSTRRWQRAIAEYLAMPAGQRAAPLERVLADEGEAPVTRFLLGCAWLDEGRPATAAQCMMIAHHQEPRLQGAALLAFTSLLWCSRREDGLLSVAVDAWLEFHQPEFDCTPAERRLFDQLAAPGALPPGASVLAGRLRRLPVERLRRELDQAFVLRSERFAPLYAMAESAAQT